MQLTDLDADALSRAIHAKEVSCREVMRATLDRIAAVNPRVNAIVSLQDEGELLRQADERDARLAHGESLGWMHGMPQAIKDAAETKGIATTLGSPLLANHVPRHDALMVERMKAAGCIVVGKTNTPEFGLGSHTFNEVFGVTRNAFDAAKSAGGSSGCAAVALATHMLAVADGSDFMGSLRNPAGWNDVYGFRPSQGRVPRWPAADVWIALLSTEGPMGRTVTDVARLLSIQAGYDPRVPLSLKEAPGNYAEGLQQDFTDVRIGWLGDYNGYLPMDDGVLSLCESALADFSALGCQVEACQPDFAMARLWQTWLTHRHFLLQGSLGAAYADPRKRPLLKPEAQWEVEGGLRLSAADVYQASVDRSEWYRVLSELFQRYDFLLLPTAQVFPFDAQQPWPRVVGGQSMDTYHRWMEVVIGPTLAGLPSISVPVGFNPAGLPMGLQIIGPAQADRAVLQLAYAHEQLTRWVERCPPTCLRSA